MPINGIETIARRGMQAVALGLLTLLLIKGLVDAPSHFDSWWYHLPWAARLAGLMSPDSYVFEPVAAVRFNGFPLLPEFLQGWFWRLTGRVESANLVSFAALGLYLLFLRHFFRVPFWLAVPALLAVPLIQAQASAVYVDLIANLGMATLIMATYSLYLRDKPAQPGLVAALLLGAFVAANSKMQLIPLAALALLFAAPPLTKWLARVIDSLKSPWEKALMLAVTLFTVMAIFFVPLKNLAQYGNPVYPMKIAVLGHTLNGPELSPPSTLGGGEMANAGRITKWFYSVTELGMGTVLNVKRWKIDSSAPPGSPLGIQGGLFGAYVAFHLLLFAWLANRLQKSERKVALTFVATSLLAAAVMPASHLLRYYMFWFIGLISLNLHFITRAKAEWHRLAIGVICLGYVLVVVDSSDQNFIRPRFQSVQQLMAERVDPGVLAQLREFGTACLALDYANLPFLYASLWHPGTDFRITAGPFFPSVTKEVEQTCAGLKVIASNSGINP
jgi:hypothetical protein